MTCLALTLLSIQTWTYGAFLAQPTLPPPPAVDTTLPQSQPDTGPTISEVPVQTPQPRPAVTPSAKPKPARAPTIAARPARYRLSDASGQPWEHEDPVWLQEFVQIRNRLLLGLPQ